MAENRDERQRGAVHGDCEFLPREDGQNAALEAHHRADDRVDDHEQRKLPEVLAQSEPN